MSQRPTTLFDLRAGAIDSLYLTVKTADLTALQAALQARFDAAPGFYADEALVLDLRRLGGEERIDAEALATWLAQHALRPIGVLADDAQLAWVGDTLARLHAPPARLSESDPEPPAASQDVRSPSHAQAPASPTPAAAPSALVVDRPLRSGQRVYAPGDLIVLESVSNGAELIAGGNIHVYGPLRGRALAGAHGDTGARIFGINLEPELVAIAGVYRTAEQPLPQAVHGVPAQIYLRDDKLCIEALGAR